MQIKEIEISKIIPYENNPRNNDEAVDKVANSIKEFGFKQPIVLDKDNVVVIGHTRLKASEQLGLEKVPCLYADDLTDDQIKALRLADNKTSEFATWDFEKLDLEIEDIELDLEPFGFDLDIDFDKPISTGSSLIEEFGIPPFSIFDCRQGYWKDRKKYWIDTYNIKSEEGRSKGLLGQGLKELGEKYSNTLMGTSVFDPVVCEIVYNWFNIKGGAHLRSFCRWLRSRCTC